MITMSISEVLKTHNESGIVCFEDGTAIICNWSNISGIPRVFITGLVGLGEELYATNRKQIPSWRNFISDMEVIYDANNDLLYAEDGEAEVVELASGQTIVAPLDWV